MYKKFREDRNYFTNTLAKVSTAVVKHKSYIERGA